MPEHVYDKGYKRVLSRRRNFLHFLQKYIRLGWIDHVGEDDIELIDKSFIDDDFRERESDIVYRVRSGDMDVVFYVILELQSRVDFTMPFRLLVYMAELLKRLFRDTPKNERERSGFRLPAVVPIVLYNGGEPWTAVRSFSGYTNGSALFGDNILDFQYLVLDLGSEDEQHILDTNTLLDNVFLLDRCGDPAAARKALDVVIRRVVRLSADDRRELMEWIADVLKRMLPETPVQDVITAFEKGDEGAMEYALERVFKKEQQKNFQLGEKRGMEKGMEKGVEKGVEKVALRMLGRNMPLEDIRELTGLSAAELEKLSATLEQ